VKIRQLEPFNFGCAIKDPLSQKPNSVFGIGFFGRGGKIYLKLAYFI
jgi:hypothetical protein